MPALETVALKQKAVLWSKNGDNTYGETKINAKIEIDSRWETTRQDTRNPERATTGFESIVYVDREIAIDSILWLGSIDDLPTTPTNLRQVKDYDEIPDIKSRNVQRFVTVVKFSNELPELA